jgi:hypothetical protein
MPGASSSYITRHISSYTYLWWNLSWYVTVQCTSNRFYLFPHIVFGKMTLVVFLSVRSETSISYKYILIVRNILGNLIYVLTSSMYWNTIFYNLCEFVRLWFSSYQLPKQNFSAFLGTNTATYVNVSAHFVAYLKNKKWNISRASFSLAYNCSCYVEASIN